MRIKISLSWLFNRKSKEAMLVRVEDVATGENRLMSKKDFPDSLQLEEGQTKIYEVAVNSIYEL